MPAPQTLTTARLLLRPFDEGDDAAFAEMNADPRVAEFLPSALTRAESDDLALRLRTTFNELGFGPWAIEVPGEARFVGFAGLARATFEASFTPCVELAWRLLPAYWGRGYAGEAARAALASGFDDLGLDEIWAWTTPSNARSRRGLERLGMKRVPALDFDHPKVPIGNPVRHHIVYRISKSRT